MSALPTPDDGLDEILEQALDLPLASRLELFEVLRRDLAELIVEHPSDAEIARRKEALRCLRAVWEMPGRDPAKKLTAAEYRATAKTLGLPMSASTITRAFGRWKNARSALLGGREPMTVEQKAIRTQFRGKTRQRGDQLESVRLFLASNPAKPTGNAYNEWVHEFNRAGRSGESPVTTAANIIQTLGGHRWLDIVAAAQQGVPIEEVARPDANPGPYLGWAEAARLAGSKSAWIIDGKTFPVPVAHGKRGRLWWREDVLAFKEGRPWPTRKRFAFQHKIMLVEELVSVLKVPAKTVNLRVRRQTWELVPRPVATVRGIGSVWLRSEVKAWLAGQGKRET